MKCSVHISNVISYFTFLYYIKNCTYRMIKLMCSLSPFTSRPGCSVDDFKNRAESCMRVSVIYVATVDEICSGLNLICTGRL